MGKVSAVDFDGSLYRLILAVELGVFCHVFQNLFGAIRCGWLLCLTSDLPARLPWACNRIRLPLQSFEYDR
jgi:hypothetical protein